MPGHERPTDDVRLRRSPDSVLESQARGLQSGQVVALVNLPIAAISAYIVNDHVEPGALFAWLSLFAAVLAARIATTELQARRATPARLRLATHTVGALVSGLMWGALPWLLTDRGTFVDFAFCGFVIAGVTAGALPSLCWHRPAYLGYLLGATLPLTGALLVQGSASFAAMGGLTLLYAILLIATAHRYSRTVLETLLLHEDITRLGQRLMSTQDELAVADLEKWRTISHLSHELRTPLNAVIGFAQILEQDTAGRIDATKSRSYARSIHESGAAILQLVEELLELSGAETGALTLTRNVTDCRRLVDESLAAHDTLAATAHVAVVTALPTENVVAWIDGNKLRLAIDQIVENALNYTPPGGRVSVTVANDSAGNAVIEIADTGTGMRPQDIDIAMSPFGRLANPLTTQQPGTGLGLPLARLLTELHGGALELHSEPGNGTTVTLRLPRRDRDRGPPQPIRIAGAL